MYCRSAKRVNSTHGSATQTLRVGEKFVTRKPTIDGKGVIEEGFVFVELQGVRPAAGPNDYKTTVDDLDWQVRYQLAAAEIPHHLQELQGQSVGTNAVDGENLQAFFTPSFDKALSSFDSGDPARTQGGLAGGKSEVFAMVDPATGKIIDFATRDFQWQGVRGERWEVIKDQDQQYYWMEKKSGNWTPLKVPAGAVVVPITVDRMTGKLVTDPQALTQVGLSAQAWQRMTNLNGFVATLGGSGMPMVIRYANQGIPSH